MRARNPFYFALLLLSVATQPVTAQKPQSPQPAVIVTNVAVTNIVASTTPVDLTVQLHQPPSPPFNLLKDWSTVWAALIAVLGIVLTAWVTMRRGRSDAQFAYAAEMMKFRLKQVQEFYAPIEVLVEQSRLVYNKFLHILEKERPDIPVKDFRLLDHIFEFQDNPNLKALIDQLLAIGTQLSKIILEKSGLIEGGVTPIYKEYMAHFSILNAASKQNFTAEQKKGLHDSGYYTRTLNREIREGYKIVLQYLQHYAKASDWIISRLINADLLAIGHGRDEFMRNLRFYEANAAAYGEKFDSFDLSTIQDRFIKILDSAGTRAGSTDEKERLKILDAGCGAGRDAEAFIKRGLAVIAADISPAMLRICRERIRVLRSAEDATPAKEAAKKSYCFELAFDEIDFLSEFDGVWASASLLHVPRVDLQKNVRRLIDALKSGGTLYMSLKYGRGEGEYGGRYFTYYSKSDMNALVKNMSGLKMVSVWLTDEQGKEVGILRAMMRMRSSRQLWLNVLIQKK